MEVIVGILILFVMLKAFGLMLLVLSLPFMVVFGFVASLGLLLLFVFGAVFTLVLKIILLPLLLLLLFPFCLLTG